MSIWYRLFVLISVVLTAFGETNYCREGTYGNNCELTCPDKCRPLQTFPCNKETGRCAEGCHSGYYGDQCDKQCFCASGICFQANGECYETGTTKDITAQNTTNRVGSTTEAPVRTCDCEAVEGEWFIIAIILIILIIILIGLMVLMFLYRRWEMKQGSRTASGRNQRRFLGIVPPSLACFGGRDSGADGPENVPLKSAHVSPPIQAENNPDAGADKLDETQTQYRQGDDHTTKHTKESNEELGQRIRDLEREKRQMKEKYIAEQNETLANLGLPLNSTNHLIKTNKLNPSIWLQCPHLKFDKARVNVKVAHVDDKMVLWNIPDPRNPGDNSRRFHQFSGTTCTAPLEHTGFYQYFEAIFDIDLKQSFGEGEVVMQLAFCEEKDQDVYKFIQGKKGGALLKAVGCNRHKAICLVFMQGHKPEHIKGLMGNSVPSREQVNIGIRLNRNMKQIEVYDVGYKALNDITLNIRERIWPMFGLCEQHEAAVSVKLQTGSDIKMWSEKKETLKPDNWF